MISPHDYDLKKLVKGQVEFQFYRKGELWYRAGYVVDYPISGEVFEEFLFPVPIADAGDAKFLAVDKAMLFMRYIRKHLDVIRAEWDATPK